MTTWKKAEPGIYVYTGQLPAGLDRVHLEQKGRTDAGNPVYCIMLQRGNAIQQLSVTHYPKRHDRTRWTLYCARKNAENYIEDLLQTP